MVHPSGAAGTSNWEAAEIERRNRLGIAVNVVAAPAVALQNERCLHSVRLAWDPEGSPAPEMVVFNRHGSRRSTVGE